MTVLSELALSRQRVSKLVKIPKTYNRFLAKGHLKNLQMQKIKLVSKVRGKREPKSVGQIFAPSDNCKAEIATPDSGPMLPDLWQGTTSLRCNLIVYDSCLSQSMLVDEVMR